MTATNEQAMIPGRDEAPAPVRVPNADDMGLEVFCLHMTARHGESLGGLTRLAPERLSEEVEELYRTFHDKIHDGTLIPGREFDHWHRRPRL